jgi:hypothetical protein
MLTILILLFTVAGLIFLGKKFLLRILQDTCDSLFCYLGLIIFISLSFIHAVRSNRNKP